MSKKREEISNEYKWDLSKIYKTNDEVEKDIKKVKELTEKTEQYKSHIMDSSKTLEESTKSYLETMRVLEKLITYANLRFHEDMSISTNEHLVGVLDKLSDQISEKLAFYTPELLKNDYDKVLDYIKENDNLKTYSFMFEELFREKEHVLSLEQEEMMARLGEILSGSADTFHMLDDVNLKFDNIKDENGKEVEVTISSAAKYVVSDNRRVRQDVFNSLFSSYKNFKNTFASLLKTNVKSNFFISKTRKYTSPLDMSLYGDNIDKKLYTSLIEKVHKNIDINHEYMEVRKRMLGVDELHMYDVYVPLVKDIKNEYTYEEAKDLVLEALSPLGETYIKDLTNLFNSNIIDVYHNDNKYNGAYSWGSYDSNPYVLMNYEGKFSDVSTIAHELGHAMHSLYSKKQPYHDHSYPIFLAEIASTVNEIFLNKYCYEKAEKKEDKMFFLNKLLDNFRSTLIRQTMFAEFELKIHDLEESGEVLTEELLSDVYYDLTKEYHGDAMVCDDLIRYEWAEVPHFYTSFYVYKYATGISVACKIVDSILNKKENALENYMEFLSSGGNNYPLEILKKTGIDIVNDDTIDKALEMYRKTLEEFKALM